MAASEFAQAAPWHGIHQSCEILDSHALGFNNDAASVSSNFSTTGSSHEGQVSAIPQAGAIVFRTDTPSPRILLVRAKKDPSQWIFPKGHLQAGESHGAAALREAHEEAGIGGIVIGLIGRALTFQSGDELVTVEYYLIECLEEVASPEGREKQWVSPPDALQQLAFEDARELLQLALREIDARVAMAAEQDRFDGFLLHEYDHLGQSLLANEEGGEKRVTFFLTLCGAVGAAVGFLVGDGALEPSDRLLVVISLLVLFTLGYVTFLRVVVRNASSDRYKNQLARLRQRFLHGEADVRIAFLPFHPYELTRRKRRTSFWRLGKGGWAETMALVESLIGGGVIAFVAWTTGGSSVGMLLVSGVLGVIAGCFVWRGLIQRGDSLYEKELVNTRDGSVPLRDGGGSFIATAGKQTD